MGRPWTSYLFCCCLLSRKPKRSARWRWWPVPCGRRKISSDCAAPKPPPSFIRRSPDDRKARKSGGNHPCPRRLFSCNRENMHGTKIFKEGIRQGRTRDEEAQRRHAEKRRLRPQGQKPQAGDRDR